MNNYTNTPITINPKLANIIGLNESIMLDRFKWELNLKLYEVDPKITYVIPGDQASLERDFPFWGMDTVHETIDSLTKKSLLACNSIGLEQLYTLRCKELLKIVKLMDSVLNNYIL